MGFFDGLKKEFNKVQDEIRENAQMNAQFSLSEIIHPLHIDDKHNWFYFSTIPIGPGHIKPRIFESETLESYNVSKDGNEYISGGLSVGRAIVGNLIAGPAGLVLGGLTGVKRQEKKVNSLQVQFQLTTGHLFTVELVNKPVSEGSREHESINNALNGIIDYFERILESRRVESDTETLFDINDNHEIVIETLRKYKQLLDEGIITEEEFDSKKKELLN